MAPDSPKSVPLVSIVLPTFNRASSLEGAVRCCLDQTWRNIEIIIVNDGSTDNTEEVAQALVEKDSRVRYIKQTNQKIPGALNTGFKNAHGDYFTWTSDDNRYEPDAIEIMVEKLESQKDLGFVYCNMKIINEEGEIVRVSDFSNGNLDAKNCIGACFMYRRSVAEAVGTYDTNAFLAEDYDYWLRISKKFQIGFIEESPYQYRIHKKSLTSTRAADIEIQAAKVRTKHARNSQEHRRIMANGFARAAELLRLGGDFGKSARYYLQSIWLAPVQLVAWKGVVASALHHRPRASKN
jgi:glycosyltransferase involved in cell wall biosynthesis